MSEKDNRVNVGLRLASMLVDHFAMTIITMIIVLPGFLITFMSVLNTGSDPFIPNMQGMMFFMIFGFSAYFNKDIFNGRSPAKRILRMQVIDARTGDTASAIKCFVRNMTIIVWPIEVIVILISPKRRIGDFFAGTRVEYRDIPLRRKMNWIKFVTAIVLSLIYLNIIFYPFYMIQNTISDKYEERSIVKYSINGSKEFIDTISIDTSTADMYNKVLNGEDIDYYKLERDSVFDDGKLIWVKLRNDFFGASVKRYIYDRNGRLVKITGYDKNGNIKPFFEYCAITEFDYDNKNNIIEERNLDEVGEYVKKCAVSPVIQMKYDENNNLIKTIYLNRNRKLQKGFTRTVNRYNAKNELTESINYNDKGEIID